MFGDNNLYSTIPPEEIEEIKKDFQDNIKHLMFWINRQPTKEKFVLKAGEGIHYTLMPRNRERVFDLHKKNENYPKGDPRSYVSLLRISYYSVLKILVSIKQDYIHIIKELARNKITTDEMKKYKWKLSPLNTHPDTADTIFRIENRTNAQKIKINAGLNPLNMIHILGIEEALSLPVESYIVSRYRKARWMRKGILFKNPGTLFFLSNRAYNRFSRKSNELIISALGKVEFSNKESVMKFLEQNRPKVAEGL